MLSKLFNAGRRELMPLMWLSPWRRPVEVGLFGFADWVGRRERDCASVCPCRSAPGVRSSAGQANLRGRDEAQAAMVRGVLAVARKSDAGAGAGAVARADADAGEGGESSGS